MGLVSAVTHKVFQPCVCEKFRVSQLAFSGPEVHGSPSYLSLKGLLMKEEGSGYD